MARFPLNLPPDLRNEASKWAERQGISLNQFILWSVAEKVGQLRGGLDDERFIGVTYRRGASGFPTPVIGATSIRVQSLVVAARHWNMSVEQIAAEYGLSTRQVAEGLRFYEAHREEIDAAIEAERRIAAAHA
jgi:uncharacterized protein (DUF433 family)